MEVMELINFSEVSLRLKQKHSFPDTTIEEVNRLRVGTKSPRKRNGIARLCSQASL